MKAYLLISLLLSGLAQANVSEVTISGKSADFLYRQFYDVSLGMTKCFAANPQRPWRGPFKCVLKVSTVYSTRSTVEIYGPAAEELMGDALEGINPSESGIACFVAQQENGSNRVGCMLKARLVH